MSRVFHHRNAQGAVIQCFLDEVDEEGMPIVVAHYHNGAARVPTMVAVVPDGGGLKVQYTASPPVDVLAGNAIWFDWAAGVVTVPTSETIDAMVTGVRVIASGGGTGQMQIA